MLHSILTFVGSDMRSLVFQFTVPLPMNQFLHCTNLVCCLGDFVMEMFFEQFFFGPSPLRSPLAFAQLIQRVAGAYGCVC